MHLIFFMVRYYPVLAVCLILVAAQFGYFFRRKKDPVEFACWAMIAILAVTVGLWIYFRGDLHSDLWVRRFLD